MVVAVHATHTLNVHMKMHDIPYMSGGQKGVDIFFVISGFVMAYVTSLRPQESGGFFLERCSRIIPSYWLVTALTIVLAASVPSLFYATPLDLAHVLASFAFVPWPHPVTGVAQPVLQVGWTLNIEMQFYLIFSLFSGESINKKIYKIFIIVGLIVLLGLIFSPDFSMLQVWTSPILFEFLFGVLIARLYIGSTVPSAWISWGALAGGAILIALLPFSSDIYHPLRWIWAGVPAALVVFGAVMLEKRGVVLRSATLRFLGDISYALYLCHYFAIGAVRAVWPRTLEDDPVNGVAFLMVVAALAIAGSAAFYVVIERPSVRLVRGALFRLRLQPR